MTDSRFLFDLLQQALIDLDILIERASDLFFHTEGRSESGLQISEQRRRDRIPGEACVVWCPVGYLYAWHTCCTMRFRHIDDGNPHFCMGQVSPERHCAVDPLVGEFQLIGAGFERTPVVISVLGPRQAGEQGDPDPVFADELGASESALHPIVKQSLNSWQVPIISPLLDQPGVAGVQCEDDEWSVFTLLAHA